MKRLAVVLACCAVLVVFLARGDDPKVQVPEETGPVHRPINVPQPAVDPIDWAEEARGLYVLESASARFALDLQDGRRFVWTSRASGREPRSARGTWSLTGSRLTLAYTHANGVEIPNGPQIAVNTFRGTSIEIKDTGLAQPVVLTKRTMLRQR